MHLELFFLSKSLHYLFLLALALAFALILLVFHACSCVLCLGGGSDSLARRSNPSRDIGSKRLRNQDEAVEGSHASQRRTKHTATKQKEPVMGMCRRSGNGGPQTFLPAACGVAQGAAQHGPSSSTRAQDPREGPSLAGRTTGGFLRHGLVRLAREEAERSRRGTTRGARDANHDDQDQAGAGLRSVLVSSLVQRDQAHTKASGKGYRFGATRQRLAERQDGGHRGAQDASSSWPLAIEDQL